MYPTTQSCVVDGILQVEHFVEHDVLHRKRRQRLLVENPADDNRIMRRIEMSQHATRTAAAPPQLRPSHEAVEKAGIQPLENVVQVEVLALRPGDKFAPANLPHQL